MFPLFFTFSIANSKKVLRIINLLVFKQIVFFLKKKLKNPKTLILTKI